MSYRQSGIAGEVQRRRYGEKATRRRGAPQVDFAFLEHWWRDASPACDPAPVIERAKATFRRLEAFEGMDDLFPKGLEKVIVTGAGHFAHVERPNEVNRRIVAFLQAAGGARGR